MPVQKGKNLKSLQEWFSDMGARIERGNKWNHYVVFVGKKKSFEFYGDMNFAKNYDLITACKNFDEVKSALEAQFGVKNFSQDSEIVEERKNSTQARRLNQQLQVALSKESEENVPSAAATLALVDNAPKVNFGKLEKVPNQHEGYFFPSIKQAVARRITNNKPVFIAGKAGCGKTEMIAHMASICKATLVRINFHVGISESQLVGKYVVKDSQTKFVYGYLPLAMKNGWWILLDEIDYAQPENLAVLQPVLEGNPLVVVQNEGEIIIPHPDFRIFATGNTKGRGDQTNSFSGTNFLNASFLDRFSVFEMEYTSKEKDIANAIVGDEVLAKKLVDMFKLFRKASDNGEIVNAAFSTRRLVQVCESMKDGECLLDAIRYEVLSRYAEYESNILLELAKDVFDANHYLKEDGWTIGQKHHVHVSAVDSNPNPAESASADWSTKQ